MHKYTIVEEEKTKHSYNWLQCYSIESLIKLLNEHGLAVVEYFSNVAGDPFNSSTNEITIVAKKLN